MMNAVVTNVSMPDVLGRGLKEKNEVNFILPKILATMGLVLASILSSSVPYIMSELCVKTKCMCMQGKIVFVLDCLVGGFYLGLTFLYFFDAARRDIDTYFVQENVHISYPLVESTACIGILIVAVIDSIVHRWADVQIIFVTSNSVISNYRGKSTHQLQASQAVHVVSPNYNKLVIILSLSLQTFFAGLAMGLQHQDSQVEQFMYGLLVYVSVVSYDIGQKIFLTYRNTPLMGFYLGLAFSLVGPVGISIGIAITEIQTRWNYSTLILSSGVLLGVSSGMFMHVSFVNQISIKLPSKYYYKGLARLLLLISGILLVSAMKLASANVIQNIFM